MVDYDMLGKTELSIHGIVLQNADLGRIADVVAEVLGLGRSDVLVTDVRGEYLVLDILKKGLDAGSIVGREKDLLAAVSALPGVSLRPDARTESPRPPELGRRRPGDRGRGACRVRGDGRRSERASRTRRRRLRKRDRDQ
ncbi:MAG: hypothetical protein M5U33_12420 [Pseudorhodoplanes sp.]|nr:hypothetical protein [Pseudorhodoplanes sp.]